MEHTTYFGTSEPLPPHRTLRAGQLECLYEHGNLRYIRAGQAEVLRLIYSAVRDADWQTAPYTIEDEVVQEQPDSFRITYTARYEMGEVRYKGTFLIEGRADCSITFRMEGEALSTFKRNRIGICVLHPIAECQGKPVQITHPDSSTEEARFPDTISPHQPFLDIQQMAWPVADGVEARVLFEGDIFETEDQRNWTDASYKTYSTPLTLPKPVQVNAGDTISQQVTLQVARAEGAPSIDLDDTLYFDLGESKKPFPHLGYARSTTQEDLTDVQVELLQQLPFDHYRVEVKLYEEWEKDFLQAASEAQRLQVPIELIAYFNDEAAGQLQRFLTGIREHYVIISSILVLHPDSPCTPEGLLQQVYAQLKEAFPGVLIGYGTNEFFTELNRNRPGTGHFDFVGYSLNPQVHATDTRSLIENVSAQQYTIATAGTFAEGKSIHVSPVTLKLRQYPDEENHSGTGLPPSADDRQFTELAAAWTLLSLRYLSGADQITYYETVGIKGVLPSEIVEDWATASPLYQYLKALKDFDPRCIVESRSSQPLRGDGLVLENEEGMRMAFFVNFEEKANRLIMNAGGSEVTLPAASIQIISF
ncbi:hypothetical protein [Telluribacter sp. SYSU D00476]|uniref:hypothetical protein n=1 Tax=Telluribacter sp. SYSU D00476 TaxID=2811430 RepID=UPI001FF25E01|nr:hypothetical protein [Telluribacter sp. SYSU D00476]